MNNYMMTMTAGPAAVAPVADLETSLFNDFISFIDRGPKTTRTYITNFRQFVAWLAYSGITRPERRDILRYREYLLSEHDAIQIDPVTGWKYRVDPAGNRITVKCKANTVTQYIRSVCQFFRWTAAAGLYPDIAANVHAPKVRNDTHRKEALTARDVVTVEKSISLMAERKTEDAAERMKDTAGRIQRATEQGKRLYAIYLLCVTCGLRTVEVSRANVKDLETVGGNTFLYVWGKGHAEADTKKAIAPEVKAAIDDYLNSRTDRYTGSSPLFVSTGNRSGGKRIAETTISKMLKSALKAAGYDSDRITAHSLRHTAGTAVQTITGDIYATQKYMRHSNPATTEIYLHTNTEKQDIKIVQDLYNYYHAAGA